MKKKFKNRKTGDIAYYKDGVFKQGRCCVDIGHEPSEEFWEDITEDYEILEIQGKYGTVSSYIEKLDKDLIDKSIFKVKRLSDGEVFTIGDKFTCGEGFGERLNKFTSFGDELFVNDMVSLDELDAPKKLLFTTKDGVNMYDEHLSYYLVTNDFKIGYCKYFSPSDLDFNLFAKIENARKFVEDNSKRYSQKDVEKAISKYTGEEDSRMKATIINYLNDTI